MTPDQVENEEAKSNVQASIQGATTNEFVFEGQRSETREAFFHMMLEWFTEYMRTNPMAERPPPHLYNNRLHLFLRNYNH